MVDQIVESLVFDDVIVWDNSRDPDWKCAGRYMAAALSATDEVYYQDDDVLVPQDTQRALVRAFYEGDHDIVANWGHGTNADGYDDLPLVCGGAVGSARAAWQAIRRYSIHHPIDDAFMYEADFVVGALYRDFRHVYLPFDINMDVAQHSSRLVNQPWQQDLKAEITQRARAIRDTDRVTA